MNSILAYDPAAGINSLTATGDKAPSKKHMALKAACQEFETVLTSIIVKEGLKSAQQMNEASEEDGHDSGGQQYTDMAHDQMASFIGRKGMLGLGDMIYDSVKDKIQTQEIKK